ncbi:hypothetical protein ACFY12_07045 [Streptomyces sp. NPDC001339]
MVQVHAAPWRAGPEPGAVAVHVPWPFGTTRLAADGAAAAGEAQG